MTTFRIKRIYDEASSSDGYRVLIDRIWPRGISKDKARLDTWAKEVAPSTELRKWFNHDPEKFSEFKKRYEKELKDSSYFTNYKSEWEDFPLVTLVYSASNQVHNQAVVLKSVLER